MGQQDGNDRAAGSETAESGGTQGPQDRSLAGCLDKLIHALNLHRLCFLFFAEALRINPNFMGTERVKKPKLLGQIRKEDMDDGGEFLLRYRDEIERFAEAAINDFGHGKGQKPIEPYDEDTWCEVEGSSYPFWKVYLQVIGWVQKTSDGVVEACAILSQAESSSDGGLQLVNDTLQAVWPHGTARWYAARSIPWDYLERMDIIITLVKEAIVKVKDAKTRVYKQDRSGTKGAESELATGGGDVCEIEGDSKAKKSTRAQGMAYASYEYASGVSVGEQTDKEAYNWLQDHEELVKVHVDESYQLPAFQTWQRYVRAGRKLHGTQKNTPRAGRPHGSSIVGFDQIDPADIF